jgi:hypothetical protein
MAHAESKSHCTTVVAKLSLAGFLLPAPHPAGFAGPLPRFAQKRRQALLISDRACRTAATMLG